MNDHEEPTTRGGERASDVGPASPDAAEPGYARALAELEEILRELDASDVDVDRLADRVARATTLIGVCRERIGAARLSIEQVIADLDGPADTDSGA